MANERLEDILNTMGTENVPMEVHALAEQACSEFVKDLPQQRKPKTVVLWEIVMRSGKTKLAAAAILMVGILAVLFSNWTVTPVYALEQTLQALHSVRFLHMKYYQTGHDEPKEFWLACDANGQITKARWHIPGWDSPEDGAKVVVWEEGKAQIWFKKKDSVVTVWEQRAVNEMLELLIAFDPKNRVQQLIKLESEGIVTLTFDEPKDKSKPITVTVDYRSGRTGREVLTINQGTFLVEKDERFAIEDGDYCLTETHEFLGYNQPIDDGMFQLAAVSPDTLQVDQTNPDIGLPKGDLTDEEIAEKVARSFYKALIAKDYAMAGSLLGGMPGDRLRDMLESKGLEFVRIVSLGPVGPHPISATRGLVVPGTLELHVNGQLISQPFDRLGVRPVHGQPDRWAIFGGF